jgi:hypothetical protein
MNAGKTPAPQEPPFGVDNGFATAGKRSPSERLVDLDLFRRRTVWWPSRKGWLLLFAVIVAPAIAWAWWGESYLAHTGRVPADTLVVESWIQEDGLHAAAAEYRSGGYRTLVITGGFSGSKGTLRRRSYAAIAERELVNAGIAEEAIITAPMPDVETQRTHTMAVAVRLALQLQGISPSAINVFTEGTHARRSRLVYAKVFGPEVSVGAIAWAPWERTAPVPGWWTSSERALDLIKETLGYPYEFLFSSGRGS